MSDVDVRAPEAVSAAPGAEDQDNSHRHSASATADRKRQAHLQATAALRGGIALHRLADGSWLASKWNLSKPLADDEVEGWLARVGVKL